MTPSTQLTQSIMAVTFAVTVVLFLHIATVSGRVYRGPAPAVTTAEPMEIYRAWEANQFRGRVLIHADRRLNAEPVNHYFPIRRMSQLLTSQNYLYVAVRTNILREIYHVVPDAAWPEATANLTAMELIEYSPGVFRLKLDDVPIYVSRLQDLPVIKEKVLVNINGDWFSENEIDRLLSVLTRQRITSDVITISGAVSAASQQAIGDYVKTE